MVQRAWMSLIALAALALAAPARADDDTPRAVMGGTAPGQLEVRLPAFAIGDVELERAFRIAMGDLVGNVRPGLVDLEGEERHLLMAGLTYDLWTRDTAINAWNGASILMPEVARASLLARLARTEGGELRIGGQYWDQMIWARGAWSHYLATGDRAFLATAFEATRNSLAFLEETEFDRRSGLFRGLGWSDGVAAYEDPFSTPNGAAIDWPKFNPQQRHPKGVGIPMQALSSNAIYVDAYRLADAMARTLGAPRGDFAEKAERLKRAINRRLWNEKTGTYRFYVSPLGDSEQQEALGHAYALLFGIADPAQTEAVLANQKVHPAGVAAVYPDPKRYATLAPGEVSRHGEVVWPQVQGLWAQAACQADRAEVFGHELRTLAKHAVRDGQFVEIYHPQTGARYGGVQEDTRGDNGLMRWEAFPRMSWAASAYARMVIHGLAGLQLDETSVTFDPCVPAGVGPFTLRGVRVRGLTLDIAVTGTGTQIARFAVDGVEGPPRLPIGAAGRKRVQITLAGG